MTAPTGQDAEHALRLLATTWPMLQDLVAGGGGHALTGMPTGGDAATLPIAVHIVDLTTKVEDTARFYARVILDEVPARHGCGVQCATTRPPRTAEQCPQRILPIHDGDTPSILTQLADRYGHFKDHDLESDFIRDTTNLAYLVGRIVTPPPPHIYLGPCPSKGPDGAGCTGEIRLRPDRNTGTCHTCGTPFDRTSHEAWLAEQMADRLLTITEIGRALATLGTPVPHGTLRRWATDGTLTRHDGDLYQLHDAHQRALARHVKGPAA